LSVNETAEVMGHFELSLLNRYQIASNSANVDDDFYAEGVGEFQLKIVASLQP
jgi:hypothetical protein